MKWRSSVEVAFLVCTEMCRAFIHHGSLSFLNLQRFQKINHGEEFHQCNYKKIPHWRKPCDEICSEKECFHVFSPKLLWEKAQTPLWQADLWVSQGLPAQPRRGAGTHPGLASSDSPDMLLWLRHGHVLPLTQIPKQIRIPARLCDTHS